MEIFCWSCSKDVLYDKQDIKTELIKYEGFSTVYDYIICPYCGEKVLLNIHNEYENNNFYM